MTIRVATPDGRMAEFPAGTDVATIERVMRAHFGGGTPPAKPDVGMLESFARGAADGATMGFADELGLVDRERQKAAKAANPWTHFAGELVGGAASMVVPGMAAARVANATSLAGRAAATALRPLTAAPVATAGQAAVQGAKLGGVYGTISGAGHADDGARVKGALEGGVVGAALGAPLGAAAHKIGEGIAITRAARNEMANADTASLAAIDRALARDAIDPSVLRQQIEVAPYGKLTTDQITEIARRHAGGETLSTIARSIGVGEQTAGRAARAFRAQNDAPVSLVERARLTGVGRGENTEWTLRAGLASPGEGRARAAEALTERQLTQAERLAARVDDLVSTGDLGTRQAAMRAAEKAAYDAAYQQAAPFDLRPIAQRTAAAFEGFDDDIARTMRRVADLFLPDNPGPFDPARNLEHFQRAKLSLDQAIETSFANNRPTPLTRQLQMVKRELMDEVGRTNPAWRAANDLFAENAVQRRLFEGFERTGFRLTPESRRELEALTQAHATLKSRKASATDKSVAEARLNMARDGLAEAIRLMVANKGDTHDHVGRLLTPAGRQYLSAILGKDDAAAIMKALKAEQAITRTYRALGGSQTTPLREAITELNGPALLTSASQWANPRAWLDALIAKGAARLAEARNNRMVPMMVETDPFRQLGMLRDIETMRRTRVQGSASAMPYVPAVSNALTDFWR